MLSQMGYQKGSGLGKHGTGRAEPIDVLVKDKRTGLGMDEERKRKREEAEKLQIFRGDLQCDIVRILDQGSVSQSYSSLCRYKVGA